MSASAAREARVSGDFSVDGAPVVELASGSVRGTRVASTGTLRFAGLPYAAPPVGALRFAPPQPVAPWAGVRDARAAGKAAPQVPPLRPFVGPALAARRGRSEDCLCVNVDTPGLDGPLRPVVVWIHGGGFATGTANAHDGSELAARGDVVVVAVGYRIGALGFVDFGGALGADRRIASNLGLRDQIAALEWVRANVAAFGGDPERVTIAGESAGSGCIAGLLVSPAARGLFHGAIAQSGALTLITEPEDAEAAAREVLAQLDLSRERADALWRLPAGELVAATHRAQRRRTGSLVTRPWWDGDVLPASLAEAYEQTAPVPLLIGWNTDEHRTFTKVRRPIMPMTRAALATAITEAWGWDEAARLLAEYPADADGLNDLGSDLVFAMPSVHLADRHAERAPVFTYRLDLQAGRFGMGAFHGLDLMLLFPQGPRAEWIAVGGPDPERAALADRFKDAWLGFVRDGQPGGAPVAQDDAAAQADSAAGWPAYEPAGARTTRIFDRTDRLVDDLHRSRRLAWAGRDVRIR